jgi:glycosyltransferase involved in cell wall biosynthesis
VPEILHITSCPTGYGTGGLGQHLAKIREDALAEGARTQVFCQGGLDGALLVDGRWEYKVFKWPPFRWRPDLRVWWKHEKFDREVARRLESCDTFVAFMGCGLHSFRRARQLGVRKLVLELPNSHPTNVRRLHGMASAKHGFERSWMGGLFERKAIREFALADELRTNSDYTSRSLTERGNPASKIVRRHLGCHERFGRVERTPHPDGLRVVVSTGSMTVAKGVPFLVEAFRNVPGEDLRLLFIGGWTSRGMRQWIEEARRKDPRIQWTTGDPAPHLATATLAVHPTFEDGWGYAPAEALAAGLPVGVSDQTGMQELIRGDERHAILPVGDTDAWTRWLKTMLPERSA